MTINEALKQYWGYNTFRPMQQEIIDSVLQGHDTLALLPTGGGKSICFQVPALIKEGICLVVSPLIALMKDQVENLNRRGIHAKAIYSGMHYKEIELTLNNCVYSNEIKFLYLSPERLKSEKVQAFIAQMNVNLLAVDEAHCISQWGFDFRPEYRQIAEIKQLLGDKVPVLALTASATRTVAQDIQTQLGFKKPAIFRQSFERKNLSYVVRNHENKEQKLLDIVSKIKGSGLVYVRNRKKTESLAIYLQHNKISSEFYHAGLHHEVRIKKQDAWLNGQTRIMICTNAFGMGIDKPNCRLVVHYEIPDSLESYYQEAGRAGRDGNKSYCVLLFNKADEAEMNNRLAQNFPPEADVRKVYQALCDYFQIPNGTFTDRSFDFDIATFALRYKLQTALCYAAVKALEQCELVNLSDAFYEPSKLKFVISEGELYKFQVENPGYDNFVKNILRTYGGLFDNYISISEQVLALRYKTSAAEIKQQLERLAKLGIAEYVFQKDTPQLSFTSARVEAKYINFQKSGYLERKAMYAERLKFMIAYGNNRTGCRSKNILEYFDEFGADNCGTCDVCLASKSTSFNPKNTEEIAKKIKNVLHGKKLNLDELRQSLRQLKEEDFVTTVRFLLDNDKLRYNQHMQLEWTGRHE